MECDGGHWQETCFGVEFMTPTRTSEGFKYSDMSISSLLDIGYSIDITKSNADYTKSDLDASCRCDRRLDWEPPVAYLRQRQEDGPSRELLAHAQSVAERYSERKDGLPIGVSTTVMYRENGRIYELTKHG